MKKLPQAPFERLLLNNEIQLKLNEVFNPSELTINSDLYDLWSEVNNQSAYQLIGFLKKGNIYYPFLVDTSKKQLPIYTLDMDWSEQMLCLVATECKQFYAFLRLINEHHKKGTFTKNQSQLLQSIPKSIDYPEFWEKLF
ncbi:MAG: hypothetical protein FGM14_13670 [Flavobacteriales bacterium]|nr:hypothetical protein [Flavobacteriales bacterium]